MQPKKTSSIRGEYIIHDFVEVFDESDVRYFVSDADREQRELLFFVGT